MADTTPCPEKAGVSSGNATYLLRQLVGPGYPLPLPKKGSGEAFPNKASLRRTSTRPDSTTGGSCQKGGESKRVASHTGERDHLEGKLFNRSRLEEKNTSSSRSHGVMVNTSADQTALEPYFQLPSIYIGISLDPGENFPGR